MHESSLMKGLIRKVEEIAREQNANRITRIRITLGPLANISPAHLREHFVMSSRGTIAEEAELDISSANDLSSSVVNDVILQSVELE